MPLLMVLLIAMRVWVMAAVDEWRAFEFILQFYFSCKIYLISNVCRMCFCESDVHDILMLKCVQKCYRVTDAHNRTLRRVIVFGQSYSYA